MRGSGAPRRAGTFRCDEFKVIHRKMFHTATDTSELFCRVVDDGDADVAASARHGFSSPFRAELTKLVVVPEVVTGPIPRFRLYMGSYVDVGARANGQAAVSGVDLIWDSAVLDPAKAFVKEVPSEYLIRGVRVEAGESMLLTATDDTGQISVCNWHLLARRR